MKFRWTLSGAARLSMAAILATSGIGLLVGCGGPPPPQEEGEVEVIDGVLDPVAGDPAAVEGETLGEEGGTTDPAAL